MTPTYPVHEMHPNIARIVEAVLFLVGEGARRKITVTQYDIVKAIFLADKAHLNKYGRPITYDNYVAMNHGPVPSTVYDILKENAFTLRRHNIEPLWTRRAAPERGNTCFAYENPSRSVDEDVLSPSDLEALRDALGTVASLNFAQIRKLTHDDPAYIAAWRDEDERRQFPMSYTALFDIPNEKRAEEIAFLSQHI